jgi:hypothetical protein
MQFIVTDHEKQIFKREITHLVSNVRIKITDSNDFIII